MKSSSELSSISVKCILLPPPVKTKPCHIIDDTHAKERKRTVWKKPHLNLARESKIDEGPTNIYTSVLSLDVHPRRLYKVPNKSVNWTIHRHTHKHTEQCRNNVSSICALSPAHNHSRRRSTPASFLLRDVPESRIHRPRCHERGADKRAPERCLRHALPIPRLPC